MSFFSQVITSFTANLLPFLCKIRSILWSNSVTYRLCYINDCIQNNSSTHLVGNVSPRFDAIPHKNRGECGRTHLFCMYNVYHYNTSLSWSILCNSPPELPFLCRARWNVFAAHSHWLDRFSASVSARQYVMQQRCMHVKDAIFKRHFHNHPLFIILSHHSMQPPSGLLQQWNRSRCVPVLWGGRNNFLR